MQIYLIASQTGMTERQLKFFMKKRGLRTRFFDEITNDQLDVLTGKIVASFPTIGTWLNKKQKWVETNILNLPRILYVLRSLPDVQ